MLPLECSQNKAIDILFFMFNIFRIDLIMEINKRKLRIGRISTKNQEVS